MRRRKVGVTMHLVSRLIVAIVLISLGSCRQAPSENRRSVDASGDGEENVSSSDAESKNAAKAKDDINQSIRQAAITEVDSIDPLKLKVEADLSALPPDFMTNIFAIHKIEPGKTILFSTAKQSWLLDETSDGALVKLSVSISPPPGSNLFILEDNKFWLVSKTSVVFPSATPSPEPGQTSLINISPELMKDSTNIVRVLFAGPKKLILANDKRANIILVEGDKARVVALDFPKMGGKPLEISSAGLMQGPDQYWFLDQERMLQLGKGSGGQWRWLVSKFKLDGQGVPPSEKINAVAMIVNRGEDNITSFKGRTFELAGAKLFEQNSLKLSLPMIASESIDPVFLNDIQPILKVSCTPCHAGYEDFPKVKTKALAYLTSISDGSMPKDSALTADQILVLKNYLTKLIPAPE